MKNIEPKTISPLKDLVLVKLNKEKITKSGIIMPDTVNKKQENIGTVISYGSDVKNIKKNQTIMFDGFGHRNFVYKDDEYTLVNDENILAIINK